jgi:hypothetical protein
MWQLMVEAGPSSHFHEEFATLVGTELFQYQTAWLGQFERMDPKVLDTKVRTFRKWQAWSSSQTNSFAPSAVAVASYLEAKREGGPTAASGTAHTLAWVSRRFGLNMCLEHPMVQAKARLLPAHSPKPAEPHELREIVHLEVLMHSQNCFVRHVAGACWALAMGTLRFRHLQRSKLLKLTDRVIAVACNQDKKPKDEAAPGYLWILPRGGVAFEDSGHTFWASVQDAATITNIDADFLLFDLAPRGCQPSEATAFLPQEMPYSRFIKCMEQLMMLKPLEMQPEQARKIISYRARRFLPSVAGLLQLSDKEASSVGNWRGAGDAAGKRLSVSSTMHVRYDDTKLQTTARTKVALVAALAHASKTADAFDIPWDKLKENLPSWEWVSELSKNAATGLTELLPRRTGTGEDRAFPLRPSTIEARPSSKREPSPSSSSSSSHSEEGDFDKAQEEAIAAIAWAAPSHKKGMVHAVSEFTPTGIKCMCGYTLKASTRSEVGLRSSLLMPVIWHTACLNRLPAYFRALAEA